MGHYFKQLWAMVKMLAGEGAYERYLSHHNATHPEKTPLTKPAFFRQEQDRKWEGVKRCC